MWGQTAGTWGLYTEQQLHVGAGGCTGCTVAFVAQNVDGRALRVGDVVEISGIAPPLAGQATPVLAVRRATAGGNPLLGVVQSRAQPSPRPTENTATISPRPAPAQILQAAPGAAEPAEHLFVVVQGLAQVRVDASAAAIDAGTPLTVAHAAGQAEPADADATSAPALGRALEPLAGGLGLGLGPDPWPVRGTTCDE